MRQLIAWTGVVTMANATWGDEAGSAVTFKLPTNPEASARNPFHKFTKRRKGRAGTRFFMVVHTIEDEDKTLYRDEVMLSGWNDSQNNGHTVKFWICNDTMGHPFEGISRQQSMVLALTELNDDNQAIDQKMEKRVETQSKGKAQKMSNVAAMLCRTEAFWKWADSQGDDLVYNDETAKQWMYNTLLMDSRSELDRDSRLSLMFKETILKPYSDWHGINNRAVPF